MDVAAGFAAKDSKSAGLCVLHKKMCGCFVNLFLWEIDKCTRVRYNIPILKEVPEMTVFTNHSSYSNYCKPFAVDGTSMHIHDILDTAVLAVSILVVHLIDLLIAA